MSEKFDRTVPVTLSIPQSFLDLIDQRREGTTRSEFVLAILRRHIKGKGAKKT
ncbi:MAG: hypothetical protein ACLP5V_03770 [Candidatus Bathyarchaeia archaeon]